MIFFYLNAPNSILAAKFCPQGPDPAGEVHIAPQSPDFL